MLRSPTARSVGTVGIFLRDSPSGAQSVVAGCFEFVGGRTRCCLGFLSHEYDPLWLNCPPSRLKCQYQDLIGLRCVAPLHLGLLLGIRGVGVSASARKRLHTQDICCESYVRHASFAYFARGCFFSLCVVSASCSVSVSVFVCVCVMGVRAAHALRQWRRRCIAKLP